jgi:REP element-mobilizing transposase RayT
VQSGHPCHVTIRVRRGVPSLRSRAFLSDFRASLRDACERGEFRVVHYSVQRDHLHLIVEATGKPALGRGMRSVGQRVARSVQRVFGRRGSILDGRYHLRILRTPREVRNAIAYVLLNARRHWQKSFGVAPPVRLDEASSARWFEGWTTRVLAPAREPPEVARPRTWLLAIGWRQHGPIDPAEVPGEVARKPPARH